MKRKLPYTIGVLSEKMYEFQEWRSSLELPNISEDRKRSFISNDFKYMSICSVEATRGYTFHGIIELHSAKYIRNYSDFWRELYVHLS